MSEPTGTQYGGFWVRFLAFLADSAIVFLVCAALLAGAALALGPELLMRVMWGVLLLGLLYWPVMQASGTQATLGKAIVGLKVARFDGSRISILRSVWRELAKVFSAIPLMLGYLLAALMPRKQGLHDLLAATYVVREGPSRVLAALAIALAGFALPIVVGPMVVDASVMTNITRTAESMIPRQELMKQVPAPVQDVMKQVAGPARDLMKQVAGSVQGLIKQITGPEAPAPKAVAKKAPAALPVAKAPAPGPAKAEAPKTEPVVLAQPTPTPAPVTKAAKPAKAKPEPVAPKAVARATPPPPPSTSKGVAGPRYNDLMTAVMYGDVDSVKELLRLGRWADKPDSRGTTPLMVAAGLGDVRTAEALLRGGANARLAVPVAEERRDGEMIQLLKRYAR